MLVLTNAAKQVELPAELPAAVQEVCFVYTSARTIGLVVGAAVVGVAVVSAPERSICVDLGRYSYSKKGTPFLFHRDYNVYVATLFKLLG